MQPVGDRARSGCGWRISRMQRSDVEVRRQGRRSRPGDRGGEERCEGPPMGSSGAMRCAWPDCLLRLLLLMVLGVMECLLEVDVL